MAETGLAGWARRNWFVPLLAVLVAIEWAFARAIDWPRDGAAEIVVLFDMCLFVPLLYVLCYRRRVALKPLLVRAMALGGLGLYFASHLIPAQSQHLVAGLGWARILGGAALVLIELWVVMKVVKLVFGGTATEADVVAHGAPPWIARLMLVEARFWKWLWRLLRGRR
ncbi:MAG TPA: hypothetical protein VGO55_05170 [Allosphingosinicella sp.]|jgi:hypothetical protein|nr:hypothetical protein [Allosphingosinicella sp.]